jgi:hypothetical protein
MSENRLHLMLISSLLYFFKFSFCNLIGSFKTGLAKKPPWKCIGINWKTFHSHLERNSIYVKKKKSKQTRIVGL